MTDDRVAVLTIGHSTLPYADFCARLQDAGVTAVADVRTMPYSRHTPQFNRPALREALRADGIAYVFLGDQLGGRPEDRSLMCDGVADYEKIARTDAFASGIARVTAGAGKYRLALMCSEQDPLECHRCLLVGRALAKRGVAVKHILSDGAVADHADIEERLLVITRRADEDMFVTRDGRLALAYRERAMKVAYAEPEDDPELLAATE